MKYLPTIKIWEKGVLDQIENGAFKIQKGQWVQCNSRDKHSSRFVGFLNTSIWLTHWQGNPTETNKKFLDAVKSEKARKIISQKFGLNKGK